MKRMDFNEWLKPHQDKGGSYFQALTREIIGQQLSGKAAKTIFGRFMELFGGTEPEPKFVLALSDDQLRGVGLSRSKANYIKNIAQAVLDETLDLKNIGNLPDSRVVEQLIKIKGIGQWTAEMFLMFTLGRENVFSHGDLGLKKGVTKIYGLESPSADELKKITQSWNPYKSFGSFALWASLEE